MGNRISDKKEKIRSMKICKEIKRRYGLTFGQNKSLTNKAKLRPDEKLRYRLAEEVKLTLEASLKAYASPSMVQLSKDLHWTAP